MRAAMGWLLGGLLVSGMAWAGEQVVLDNETAQINYSVGFQIGSDFRKQGVELNPEALVQGIHDALGGGETLLSQEQMQSTLVGLKRRIVARDREQKTQALEKYRGEGREFLAENAKKEGVVSLPSGLQYKVLRQGTGRQATLQDNVTVEYRGTLIDGTEFDRSDGDGLPATMPLSNVIPGWKEALPLMKEGAKWQLFLPAELAFGERGPLADRTVIYEVQLVAVQPAGHSPTAAPTAPQ